MNEKPTYNELEQRVKELEQTVSERKHMEEEFKVSEEKYRAIFDSVNDAIMIHDVETGRPLETNPKMVELLGYTREELTQMKISDWIAFAILETGKQVLSVEGEVAE